ALSEEKAKLVELLVGVAGKADLPAGLSAPGNQEDQGSLVKAAYQAFGDRISVGRFEQKRVDRQTKVGLSGGLGVAIGQFGLGVPTAEVSGRKSEGTTTYTETSGTLRVQRESQHETYRGRLEGSVAALSGQAINHENGEGVISTTGLAAGNLMTGSIDFYRSGQIDTQHRLVYDGEELPGSFATTTYLQPGEFVDNLAQQIDGFAESKSSKYFPARHAADPAESADMERQNMVNFTSQLMSERDMTAAPQMYYEFGNVVEASNILLAEADLLSRSGDHAAASEIRDRVDSMHQEPANREGRFLISSNERRKDDSLGVNGSLGLDHSALNRMTEKSLRFT
ncbi:MAG: hypothetical protein ACK40L_05030, partial [Hydrogenophaga sp.]